MGSYVFEKKDGGVVIYANHNDSVLCADGAFRAASTDLGYNERLAKPQSCVSEATIAFLHGGATAEALMCREKPPLYWKNDTLFILFSSNGFAGRRPESLVHDGVRYLVAYIQASPSSESFDCNKWEELIQWGIEAVGQTRQSPQDSPDWAKAPKSVRPEATPDCAIAARLLFLACRQDKSIAQACRIYAAFWGQLPAELQEILNAPSPDANRIQTFEDSLQQHFESTLSGKWFPCSASILRGQLRHSWLENQVFDFDSGYVASLWRDGQWTERIKFSFPRRLQQALELADGLVEAFSPAQLVETIAPFKILPKTLRTKIGAAVKGAYLAVSDLSSQAEPLRIAILALRDEFAALSGLWEMPRTPENEAAVRCCWDNIQVKGKVLHTVLDEIPKGVVLP